MIRLVDIPAKPTAFITWNCTLPDTIQPMNYGIFVAEYKVKIYVILFSDKMLY